ncbi:MAG TPA: FKBP-type peptidyl-prolyl cis-trans isomerase [Gemmatimonadales bacterium]|nr:FKBP-type peptidyl-prolyl cis-trans isomerase [Gemmatimonadales bacterium]
MRRAFLLLALIILTGCSLDPVRSRPLDAQSSGKGTPVVGEPETLTYDPSLNVDLAMMARTPSGLYWKDITVGTGAEAVPGSKVSVEYTGWFADARKFDGNKGSSRPFSFVIGARRVIDGWDEGVAGMRVGGTRLLVIPPALGYGPNGMGGVIPGNATLVFEVEVLDVTGGR